MYNRDIVTASTYKETERAMIECKERHYHVTGVAFVDGEAQTLEYNTEERDARAEKKAIAAQFGVKAAQVAVNIVPSKSKFEIDCSFEQLMEALEEADINVIAE